MRTRIALVLSLTAVAALAASGRVTVSVEQAKVRKAKAFYAPALATVRFQQALEAGPAEDGWLPVTVSGKKGWLHESAVASKAGKVRSGAWSGSDEATQEEVTLAGKGFNEEVEKAYRSGRADLDYAGVDAMEARSVPDAELTAFLKAGKTLPQGAR
ncbi:MAG: SH3 domain-containing protein [Elusimicrobia bacterium]|nr:SH3 domain-containing protein [Elusimicrobiota bacterium]